MPRVLLSWIGRADQKAADGDSSGGLGPLAQAVEARAFDHLVLLTNDQKARWQSYEKWLRARTTASVVVRQVSLRSPTDYGDIYRAVSDTLAWTREKYGARAALTLHLSPGTPAMQVIWILVSARERAELLQSSREAGVETANVPFEIAAEFVPALVRQADERLERLGAGLRPDAPAFAHILHRSDAMKRLVERAQVAAAYSAPVLIEGESGTGKELLASAIHEAGPRASKPFVAVNCGAIPKDLVESEFFGHEKGAFTGANAVRAGHFEAARGGTLFLDEVGELPLGAQVKLLRALQEKKVTRVGSSRSIDVDVRVVAATNRDLEREVAAGRFREDLYFRLAVLLLRTPPLRDRQGDVGLLLEQKLARLNEDAGSVPGGVQKKLSPGARALLLRHTWPGNVRELEATLTRAVVWSRGTIITEEDAREAIVGHGGGAARTVLDQPLGNGFDLEALLGEVTRHYLQRAMADAQGKKTRAAELIGFKSYQRLEQWLRKHRVKG